MKNPIKLICAALAATFALASAQATTYYWKGGGPNHPLFPILQQRLIGLLLGWRVKTQLHIQVLPMSFITIKTLPWIWGVVHTRLAYGTPTALVTIILIFTFVMVR